MLVPVGSFDGEDEPSSVQSASLNPEERKEALEKYARYEQLGMKHWSGDVLSPEETAELQELHPLMKNLTKKFGPERDEGSILDNFTDAFMRGVYYGPLSNLSETFGAEEKAERVRARMQMPDIASEGGALEMIGEGLGSAFPTFAALASIPFTGGGSSGFAAPLLMSGYYGLQGFGAGKHRVQEHYQRQGKDVPVVDMIGGGLVYGLAEALPELAGFAILKRLGRGALATAGRKMVKEGLLKNPSATKQMVGKLSRVAAYTGVGGAVEEGFEETVTQLSQNAVDIWMTQVDPDMSITNGVAEAMGAGAAVGLIMGPFAGAATAYQRNRFSKRYGGEFYNRDGEEVEVKVLPAGEETVEYQIMRGGERVDEGMVPFVQLEDQLYQQGLRRKGTYYLDVQEDEINQQFLQDEQKKFDDEPGLTQKDRDFNTQWRVHTNDGDTISGRGFQAFIEQAQNVIDARKPDIRTPYEFYRDTATEEEKQLLNKVESGNASQEEIEQVRAMVRRLRQQAEALENPEVREPTLTWLDKKVLPRVENPPIGVGATIRINGRDAKISQSTPETVYVDGHVDESGIPIPIRRDKLTKVDTGYRFDSGLPQPEQRRRRASQEPDVEPPTLADAVGAYVSYNGYEGFLRRDTEGVDDPSPTEGTYFVETEDGREVLIEEPVEQTEEADRVRTLDEVGVQYRPSQALSGGFMVKGKRYSYPEGGAQAAVTFDEDGAPASITGIDQEGGEQTFTQPDLLDSVFARALKDMAPVETETAVDEMGEASEPVLTAGAVEEEIDRAEAADTVQTPDGEYGKQVVFADVLEPLMEERAIEIAERMERLEPVSEEDADYLIGQLDEAFSRAAGIANDNSPDAAIELRLQVEEALWNFYDHLQATYAPAEVETATTEDAATPVATRQEGEPEDSGESDEEGPAESPPPEPEGPDGTGPVGGTGGTGPAGPTGGNVQTSGQSAQAEIFDLIEQPTLPPDIKDQIDAVVRAKRRDMERAREAYNKQKDMLLQTLPAEKQLDFEDQTAETEPQPQERPQDLFGEVPQADAENFREILSPLFNRYNEAAAEHSEAERAAERAKKEIDKRLQRLDPTELDPEFTTEDGQYSVYPGGRIYNNQTGKEVTARSQNYADVVADYYKDRLDKSRDDSGEPTFYYESRIDPEKTPGLSPQQLVEEIAYRSQNPFEILEGYMQAVEAEGYQDLIDEKIIELGPYSTESFKRHGDPNWMAENPQLTTRFLGGETAIDGVLLEIEEATGVSIDENEVVRRLMDMASEVDPTTTNSLAARFEALTGFRLTRRVYDTLRQEILAPPQVEGNQTTRQPTQQDAVQEGESETSATEGQDRSVQQPGGAGGPQTTGVGATEGGRGPAPANATGRERPQPAEERPGIVVARADLLPQPEEVVSPDEYSLGEDQRFGVNLMLSRFRSGGKGFLLADGTGIGKAQPLDAKLLTPNGWKRMGDIAVGDKVISVDGSATKVTGVFPQGEKDVYSVVMDDGSSTETCDEHLWFTQTWRERRNKARNLPGWGGKVRELSEIRESLRHSGGQRNHMIPMVSPVEFGQKETTIDPYVLGVLLGDGTFRGHSVGLSTADAEIVEAVSSALPDEIAAVKKSGSKYDYSLVKADKDVWQGGENWLLSATRELGLDGAWSHTKFIPEHYKINDFETRLAIFQGLMDTDGTVSKQNGYLSFCTVSEQLVEDVKFLVESFGGIGRIKTHHTTYTHNGERRKGKLSYRVSITLPPDIEPFRLKRKADHVIPRTKYVPKRYIDHVDYVGRKETQCIMVEHPSHLYVTDDFIVTHNTFQMLVVARKMLDERGGTAIITTISDQKIQDFKAEAKRFGVSLDDIIIGTYVDLQRGQRSEEKGGGSYGKGEYTIALFDESHKLKNTGISTSENGATVAANSDHVVYATATPTDRITGATYFMADVVDMNPFDLAQQLGYTLEENVDEQGNVTRNSYLNGGFSWDDVIDNLLAFRDQMIAGGAMVRREMPFWGEVDGDTFDLTDEQLEEQDKIEAYWQAQIDRASNVWQKSNRLGQRILELSRWTETQKAEQAYRRIIEAIEGGRKPILIAEGYSNPTIKGLRQDPSLESTVQQRSLVNQIEARLNEEGYVVAKGYGKNKKGQRTQEIEAFQRGERDVLIGTPQTLGTGIDLDDQSGDAPRTLILATPNFSGDVMDQMLGRVSRRNTQSASQVYILVAKNSISDSRRVDVMSEKIATLNAVRAGQDADLIQLQQDAAELQPTTTPPRRPPDDMEAIPYQHQGQGTHGGQEIHIPKNRVGDLDRLLKHLNEKWYVSKTYDHRADSGYTSTFIPDWMWEDVRGAMDMLLKEQSTAKTPPELRSLQKEFHRRGRMYFGDKWDQERPRIVSMITNGRTRSNTDMVRDDYLEFFRVYPEEGPEIPGVPFSMGQDKTGPGLKVSDVQSIIPGLLRRQKTQVVYKVVKSYENLPENIKRDYERYRRKMEETGQTPRAPNGVYMPNGKDAKTPGTVYLVADQFHSVNEAYAVALHEAVAHHGIRELLLDEGGDQNYVQVMENLYRTLRTDNVFMQIVKRRGFDLDNTSQRHMAVEEMLALYAERNVSASWFDKTIVAIRDFLQQATGANFKLSERDIRVIVASARDYVYTKTGQANPANTPERHRASVGPRWNREMPAWSFTAFHGSPYRFDQFDMNYVGSGEGVQAFGWGLYFTDSRDVADYYRRKEMRKRMSASKVEVAGTELDLDQLQDADPILASDVLILQEAAQNGETARFEDWRSTISETIEDLEGGEVDKLRAALERPLEDWQIPDLGAIYETTIHAGKDPADYDYLQWRETPRRSQIRKIASRMRKEGHHRLSPKYAGLYEALDPDYEFTFEDIPDGFISSYGYARKIRQDGELVLDVPSAENPLSQEDALAFWRYERRQARAYPKDWTGEVIDRPINETGEILYKNISQTYGSAEAASKLLLRAGIDGVRFRGDAGQSAESNYVVFDDNEIQINQVAAFSLAEPWTDDSGRRRNTPRSLNQSEIAARGAQPDDAQATQIGGTKATYLKIGELINDDDAEILDFGGGLGLGTEALREQGKNVQLYEPYPAEDVDPDFTLVGEIEGEYDVIVNNYVLNVVGQDTRDQIVEDIYRLLKPGGSAIITSRTWAGDINQAAANATYLNDDAKEMITSQDTYQKGFTTTELKQYLRDLFPDAEVTTFPAGKAGAQLRKPGVQAPVEAVFSLEEGTRKREPYPKGYFNDVADNVRRYYWEIDRPISEKLARQKTAEMLLAINPRAFWHPLTEIVPVRELVQYREYDRRLSFEAQPSSDERIERYRRIIRQEEDQGFFDSLMLDYSAVNGKLYLAEGNHRLNAAREEDLFGLPVRVVVSKSHSNEPGRVPPQAYEGEVTFTYPDGTDYVHISSAIRPSQLGLTALGIPPKQFTGEEEASFSLRDEEVTVQTDRTGWVDPTGPRTTALLRAVEDVRHSLYQQGWLTADVESEIDDYVSSVSSGEDITENGLMTAMTLTDDALFKSGDRRYFAEVYEEHLDRVAGRRDTIGEVTYFDPTGTVFDFAKANHGTTTNLNEAGYLLPDGTYLDFSGKRTGEPVGTRNQDHRQIAFPDEFLNGEEQEQTQRLRYMDAFMKRGAIRVLGESETFHMKAAPSRAQISKIAEAVEEWNGAIALEMVDGDRRFYNEFTLASPRKIAGTVRRFWNGGDMGMARFSFANDNPFDPPQPQEIYAGPRAGGFEEAKGLARTFESPYDGKERFEIDTSQWHFASAIATAKEGETYRLEDVLSGAKTLFYNYPALRDLPITFDRSIVGYGSFQGDYVALNPERIQTEDDALRALTHELQHAVQLLEGFAIGSSQKLATRSLLFRWMEARDSYRALQRLRQTSAYVRAVERLKEGLGQDGAAAYSEFSLHPAARKHAKLVGRIRELGFAPSEETFAEFDPSTDEIYAEYFNTAGEIEAREVADRLRLTPEQREQVERFSDGPPMNLVTVRVVPPQEPMWSFVGDYQLPELESAFSFSQRISFAATKKKAAELFDKWAKKYPSIENIRQRWLTPTVRRMRLMARKYRNEAKESDNEALEQAAVLIDSLANKFFATAEQHDINEPTFNESRRSKAVPFLQRLSTLTERVGRSGVREIFGKTVLGKEVPDPDRDAREVVTRMVREGDLSTPEAQEMRAILDDMWDYLLEAEVVDSEDRIENYVPRVYDKKAIRDDEEGFQQAVIDGLIDEGVNPGQAQYIARGVKDLVLYDDFSTLRHYMRNADKSVRDIVRMDIKGKPWFLKPRSLAVKDRFIEDYLENDFQPLLTRYIMHGISHGEFIKAVGKDGGESLLRELSQMGVDPEDLGTLRNVIDAHAGVHGIDQMTGLRRAAGNFQDIIALSTLAMAGISSLSEFGTPIIRTGFKHGFKGLYKGLTESIKTRLGGESSYIRLARESGAAMDAFIEQLLQEHLYGSDRPLSPLMARFYKWNGLEPITKLQRYMGVAAARYMLGDLLTGKLTDAKAKELGRLGLGDVNRADFKNWIERYDNTTGQAHENMKEEDYHQRYMTAILRAVDQMVVHGSASTKPLYGASKNPAMQIAFQLNTFIYAFREGPLAYIWDELDDRALGILMLLLPMLALQAVAMSVKGVIRGREPEFGEGIGIPATLFHEAGLTGTAGRFIDAGKSEQYGVDSLLYLAGPGATRLSDMMSATFSLMNGDGRDMARVLSRTVPVGAQLPPVRDTVEGTLEAILPEPE